MSQTSRSFNIVVGCDFSPLAQLALSEAAGMALRQPRASVHVIHVLDHGDQPIGHVGGDVELETRERIKALAESGLRAAGATPGVVVSTQIVPGHPATEILRLAEVVRADMIVVGTHGKSGVKRLLVGSVAESVVRGARCPVLVVRAPGYLAHSELEPDPPCPDCVAMRAEPGGGARWCSRHERGWSRPHRYSYQDAYLHPFHPDRTD